MSISPKSVLSESDSSISDSFVSVSSHLSAGSFSGSRITVGGSIFSSPSFSFFPVSAGSVFSSDGSGSCSGFSSIGGSSSDFSSGSSSSGPAFPSASVTSLFSMISASNSTLSTALAASPVVCCVSAWTSIPWTARNPVIIAHMVFFLILLPPIFF